MPRRGACGRRGSCGGVVSGDEGRVLAVRLRAQGESYRRIGQRLGVSDFTARSWVEQARRADRAERQDLSRRLRAEGFDYRRIGQLLGVSSTTIQRWVRDDYAARHNAVSRAWKEANRDANRERDLRRQRDTACVGCGVATGALDDAGWPHCLACQREAREQTSHATAECPSCEGPMLSSAPMCGLCALELQEMVRGA